MYENFLSNINANFDFNNINRSFEALNTVVEVDGISQTLNEHIKNYIKSLSYSKKISIILNALQENIEIDNYTINYEPINIICQEIIVNIFVNPKYSRINLM